MESTIVARGRWMYVVTGVFTTMVAISFARMSYGVILPYMSESLSLTYKQSGFLGTVTSLGYLSLVLAAGILAVKWGGKRTILAGISCTTLGFLGLTFTMNYTMTLLFMLLLGIGTAFTFTTLISLVTALFPEKRGLVIGLMTSGIGIGGLITGLFVPYISELYPLQGWRITWGLFSLVAVITLIMILIFIKDPPVIKNQNGGKLNKLSRSKTLEIYKNPKIILVGSIYGIVGLTYLAQSIFIMSFMVEYGLEPKIAGQLIAISGIVSIFSAPTWGFISDRIGRSNSILITISLTFVAMSLTLFSQSLIGFTFHMILLSATVAGLFTLVQTASMDHVSDPQYMPIAFSYVTFFFAAGQLLGPMVAGWLIEDLGGFETAFMMLAAILALGIVLSLILKAKTKTKLNPETVN